MPKNVLRKYPPSLTSRLVKSAHTVSDSIIIQLLVPESVLLRSVLTKFDYNQYNFIIALNK